jgi:hypothetical protein
VNERETTPAPSPRESEEREPVFVAANGLEAGLVEKLLDEAGIDYEEKLEATMREDLGSRVCYQGILFEVFKDQVDGCRRLLREKGLGRGVV